MLPPAHYIGAVEAIPGIVPLVERLRDAGAAYELDGDIYFSVECDPALRQGVRPRRGRDAACCPPSAAATRTGRARRTRSTRCCGSPPARASRSWDGASLGPGRPGWHIECVAIALDHLGMGFDVQGGGSDLAFPHHEMGASHAQALTGEYPYAKAYVHAGHGRARRREDVEVQGQPGLRLHAAARRASTRPRSGWRCSRTTTGPTGSGPTRCSARRSSGWGAGGRPSPGPTGRRRTRSSRRCGTRSPTISTLRRRWPPSTAGPRARLLRRAGGHRGARARLPRRRRPPGRGPLAAPRPGGCRAYLQGHPPQGRGELRGPPATGRWSGHDSNSPTRPVTTYSRRRG